MKIICLLDNLKNGIAKLERISAKNTALPILNNILISAKKTGITLQATNLEIAIITLVNGKVEEEGETTVPLKVFSSYLANISGERLSLEQRKIELVISANGNKTAIKTLNAEDFPLIPQIKKDPTVSLNAHDLRNALAQVVPSVIISETRPEISGVFFSAKNTFLYLVGTDSFRLAEKKLAIGENTEFSFILPLRTVDELIRLLDAEPEKSAADLVIDRNQILIKTPSFSLISRLIEGNFPAYEQIIPTRFKTTITLPQQKLVQAVKLNSFFTSKRSDIDLRAVPSEKKLYISSANNEVGENSSVINDVVITGEEIATKFNYRYILLGISSILGESVNLKFSEEKNTVSKLVIMSEHDDNFQYIVMPMLN
jgi:DNA polymerase-3 subunit beta